VNTEVAGQPAAERDGDTVAAPTMGAVARGVSWKVLSLVVGQGCWYASLFVLAVLLPPSDFGIVAVGVAVLTFTLLLLESGTGGSLVIASELAPAVVYRALVRISLAGIAGTVIFGALAGPISHVFANGSDVGALRVIGLGIGLSAAAVVPNALLSKHLRFKAAAQIWIAAAVIGSAAAIVAAALGAGVWALVIRLIVNQLIVTVLTFVAARDLLPRPRLARARVARPPGASAFLFISIAGFIAWTCDNLAVGAFTNPTQLGLYALAFSLAFAPLTQLAWGVGQVLFPSIAAAKTPEIVQRQTLKAVRLMALILLPLAPPAIALAPGLVPALLGHRWQPMVVPFQILVLVGVGQGVLNTLGESLAGAGVASARTRSRIDMVWAVSTIGAVIIGVNVWGIRGAALAHVVTFSACASFYVWRGCRRIGLSAGALSAALRGVAGCVAVQGAATAAMALGVHAAGGGWLAAGIAGAACGLLALLATMRLAAPSLLREGFGVLAAARGRGA